MDITEVKVFPVNEDKLKAYVTIIFDNCFVVRDLKIINGNTGLFVAMPSKKRKDGTFRDIAHPLNSELRSTIEKKVLQAYEDELKKMSSAAAENIKVLGQRKRDYDDDGP
jgi:stage V sporulation protein G